MRRRNSASSASGAAILVKSGLPARTISSMRLAKGALAQTLAEKRRAATKARKGGRGGMPGASRWEGGRMAGCVKRNLLGYRVKEKMREYASVSGDARPLRKSAEGDARNGRNSCEFRYENGS